MNQRFSTVGKFFNRYKSKIIPLVIGILIFVGAFWYANQNPKASDYISQSLNSQSNFTVNQSSMPQRVVDFEGRYVTKKLQTLGLQTGFLSSTNIKQLGYELPITITDLDKSELDTMDQPQPLSELIPAPEIALKKSRLVWPEYSIDAPIIFTQFEDLFQTTNGQIDFTKSVDNNPVDSPVQKKLVEGVAHLAFSPHPGEIGNSYIIGHSSNFSSVKSDYNEVFKSIERVSKPGEVFTIYDAWGRELKFKVYQAIEVKEEDSTTAYNSFDKNKRIVTLQGSILERVNGKLLPTKRWLTRAELVLE